MLSMQLPFEKKLYAKALKHAFGLAAIGFGLIWLIWGEILLVDVFGMSMAIPLVAYIIHMLRLFDTET